MENSELNRAEQEQNPEVRGSLEELDGQAREVAEELEDIDVEDLDDETKATLIDKVVIVIGAIDVIGGGLMMVDASVWHPDNLRGMHHALEMLGSSFARGAGVELFGIAALLSKYSKLKQIFKKEDSPNKLF